MALPTSAPANATIAWNLFLAAGNLGSTYRRRAPTAISGAGHAARRLAEHPSRTACQHPVANRVVV
eukprot:57206-Lingulodinium_polyedra.AAC.1